MVKAGVLIFLLLLIVPVASAAVTIQKSSEIPVVIAGSTDPVARYTLTLTNNGGTNEFQIYSLVGLSMTPEKITLESNKASEVMVEARPNSRILSNTRGLIKFEYEIFNSKVPVTRDELLFRLVDMKDVFYFRPASLQPGDLSATIGIQNLENAKFENVKFVFVSDLFEGEKTLTINPLETVNITLPIDQNVLKSRVAGTYPISIRTSYHGADGKQTFPVKYLEKGGIAVKESSEGIIIRFSLKEKTNEGNVPISVTISDRKNIITRLLTTQDPKPTSVSKRGFFVTYTWQEQLQPSQTLHVEITTNYTLPFIAIILIVLIAIVVRVYTLKTLSLTKRVSFVRTRGGEFALKVTIRAHARKSVSNVTINDRIPHAMKLYESFGLKPDSIDESTRRISWKLAHLNAGESRIFSYIMYSKIRVVGSFELPMAHASYTSNGKPASSLSNKTTFAAEFTHSRE